MDFSPFSRLSPELRNLICEFVFHSDYAITLQNGRIQHPITRTCHQFRFESLGMYYALSRFNAHLDDGPATPLAKWLRALGSQCLLLNEVNIWDMHMLNATLHGQEVTQRLLNEGTGDGKPYTIQPVGSWLLNRGWYLKDIVLALHSMNLSLARLCIRNPVDGDVEQLHLTSHFAIVPCDARQVRDERTVLEGLCKQLGFNERMWKQLILELADGKQEVRLREGRRDIVLKFQGLSLLSIRQEFISYEESFSF